ncbi:hypothetical protein DFH09DRAFT_1078735 [Mycena vulgaris]|nr:hypothetical protein DFH09DRAFT_1078735 [Mycena vulgaris]
MSVQGSVDIKMRVLNEDGREVLELLSDSEPDTGDPDLDLEMLIVSTTTMKQSHLGLQIQLECNCLSSLTALIVIIVDADDFTDNDSDSGKPVTSSGAAVLSDDNGTSLVHIGKFCLTQKLTVERIEYQVGPAVIYPIHRTPTAIVGYLTNGICQLRDPATKELYTLNTIIMNTDNDLWDWLGSARTGAKVIFAPGEKAINCQLIHYRCKGVYVCSELNTTLRSVVHFKLDLAPRNAIITTQQETQNREGNTQEERVAL